MPPRKRKEKDKGLPPYTYRGRSAFEYRPYLGRGVPRPNHKLCRLDAPMSLVWAKYELHQTTQPTPHTLEWLLREYAASKEFTHRGKKPKSQKTISEQLRMLEKLIIRPRGRGLHFGQAKLSSITPGVIRSYLDARLAENAPVAGNRERALISKAWSWGFARDKVKLNNPCEGVERNPEEPRQHYATDNDYDAWINFLVESGAPWYLAVVEEICYLCRMRKIEVIEATKAQILDDGFDTLRRKGSRDAITTWSPRLRAAFQVAAAFEPGKFSARIVTNTHGQKLTESGFNSSRQRWIKKALKEKIVSERFTTHDLKRKGATDSDLPATVSTGNSASMSLIYDVKKLIATATR